MTNSPNGTYEQRVSRCEAELSRNDARIKATERTLQSVSEAMSRVDDRVRQGRKVPWQNILAGLTLAFSIFGAFIWVLGSGYFRLINENKQDIRKITEGLIDHEQADGHPVAVTKTKFAFDNIRDRAAHLNREFSLQIQAQEMRIDKLESLLRTDSWKAVVQK